ncbi:MAG: T9SS type A sorting domain-containing protein, partial [Flavobacteriales bacterium]|nr:T9SS type A sorting domain-containing protein [Flavobacteriales bacterium]
EMLPDGSELMLWPNPVRDGQVNLLLNGLTDDTQRVTIDVYDMFGKRVRSIEQDNSGEVFNTVLDMQGVASGIYLVNVTVNGRLYQHRVNVQ